MEIKVKVINPINDQEVEVTLIVNTMLNIVDGVKYLNVSAQGTEVIS